MTQSISFIHAADLHLDSPFKGLTDLPDEIFSNVKESTFVALDNLVQAAIQHEVDFVLLVGDLFDHERQSLKAQVRLRDAFETLKKHDVNVYLSYGNHDFIQGNVYPISYPDNVFIFEKEEVSSFTFEKYGQKIATIYGFSYEERAVTANKAIEYEIQDKSIPFHIATLHGSLYGSTGHDPYASFQLSDLVTEPFDYWALGHIHKREVLSETPPIIYPGNTQGRHRHETGEKGCYFVELSEGKTNFEFIPLQTIQFESFKLDISTCENIDDVERKLSDLLFDTSNCKLIDLTFISNNRNILSFETDGLLQELIELMNESLYQHEKWQYIYAYRIESNVVEPQVSNHFFIGEMVQMFEEMSLREELADLYRHPVGRKFLEPLSEDDLKNEAKNYLFHQLLKVEEGE